MVSPAYQTGAGLVIKLIMLIYWNSRWRFPPSGPNDGGGGGGGGNTGEYFDLWCW